MTLEEAQEQIVSLNEQITEITNERETLRKNNEKLTADLNRVRELNQRYFERLSQQFVPPGPDPQNEEPPSPTCEDFARSLKI